MEVHKFVLWYSGFSSGKVSLIADLFIFGVIFANYFGYSADRKRFYQIRLWYRCWLNLNWNLNSKVFSARYQVTNGMGVGWDQKRSATQRQMTDLIFLRLLTAEFSFWSTKRDICGLKFTSGALHKTIQGWILPLEVQKWVFKSYILLLKYQKHYSVLKFFFWSTK